MKTIPSVSLKELQFAFEVALREGFLTRDEQVTMIDTLQDAAMGLDTSAGEEPDKVKRLHMRLAEERFEFLYRALDEASLVETFAERREREELTKEERALVTYSWA